MLISDTKNFLFVHVQKTAGTSLTQVLAPVCLQPSQSKLNRLGSKLRLVSWRHHRFSKHAPLSEAQEVLPPAVYAAMFKFAFVRNPWSRLVSWYEYILRTESHHRRDRVIGLGGFDAFVEQYTAHPRRSQWSMLANRNGQLGVDFVGRFEHLQRDLAQLTERFGLHAQVLPHVNRIETHAWQSHYSPRSIEWVRQRWRQEIEVFGYEFEV